MISKTTLLIVAALASSAHALPLRSVVATSDGPKILEATEANHSIIKDCGASCVAIVSSLVGPDQVRFEDAQKLVDPDGDGLASMGDLVQGLTALGITSSAMGTSDLRIPDGLNILHVSSSDQSTGADHFIVSEELGGGRFRFYCPPIGTKTGDARALEDMWSGHFVHLGPPARSRWALVGGAVILGLLVGGVLRLYSSKRRTKVSSHA